jgi:hypothetical protein
MASLFPDNMMVKQPGELSLESVAGKLTYFHEQLHLLHWTTMSYAEHMALGGLYDYVHDFKDGVLEKLMGYANRRVRGFKVEPVSEGAVANTIVSDLIVFAHELKNWARANDYDGVENLAQSLSGEAVKTRYLLTLS